MVEASDGRLVAGDTVGLSGLQEQYDELLGGTRGVRVTRVPVEGEPEELLAVTATDGPDLALTLDTAIQQAGDDALAGSTAGNGNAALVAMDTSTGNILAVANTPATGENRALTGRYAPGSTFKAVSTLALLDSGLTPAETVPCPATATVAGRSFRNVDGFALGAVPFSEDFAQSCNTAFVGLSSRLAPGDLRRPVPRWASAVIGRSVRPRSTVRFPSRSPPSSSPPPPSGRVGYWPAPSPWPRWRPPSLSADGQPQDW
jgi:cell division protein FtsI/penicillin-binding protein 2